MPPPRVAWQTTRLQAAMAETRCRRSGTSAAPLRHNLSVTGTRWMLRHAPRVRHASGMFAIDDATVAAVRQAFEDAGEFAAVMELRRRYAGIGDLAHARRIVRIVLAWQPVSAPLPADRP
jgi:hypothetical protein